MNPFVYVPVILAVVALSFTAGCKNQKTPGAAPSSGRALTIAPTPPPARQTAPPTTAPAPESSDLLAHKTQVYAKEIEQLIARQRAREAAAATRPASPPSPAKPVVESNSPSAPSATPSQPPSATPSVAENTQAEPLEPSPSLTANRRVSLPPSDSGSVAQTPASAAPAVAAPSSSPPPASGQNEESSDDALGQQFLQRVHDYPNEIAPQLNYQLFEFIQGRSVPVMRPMTGMRTRDRDILNAVLDALTNFRSAVRADNNLLQSQKIKPFLNLADRLRAQADLTLPTLRLCRRVEGFGAYDPIEPARFTAGKAHPAIIYCEIANFSSTRNDKQMWTTKISEKEVLYTEGGLPVWPADPKPRVINDVCRNRRHDFFIVKLIHLPASLTLGRYLLKVTIIDQQTNRIAEGTIPIDIVAE